MDLSIIIVNWNTKDMLKDCLFSIKQTKGNLKVQIIVVDNASSDGSKDMVRNEFPDVALINSGDNLGFARANNLAIPYAEASMILFLNPDTIVRENALKAMVDYLNANPLVGAVGCKAKDLSGRVQDLGLQKFPSPLLILINFLFVSEKSIGMLKNVLPYKNPEHSGYVIKLYGACLMIKKVVLEQIGCFDDRFFMYCEDVDLCHRIITGGWKLYYLNEAEIIHLRGGTSSESTNYFSTLMKCESVSKLMQKYYKNNGKIRYRLVVFVGSHIRLLMLVVLKMIYCLRCDGHRENLNKSFNKYITMIKWSLNLKKPIIKR